MRRRDFILTAAGLATAVVFVPSMTVSALDAAFPLVEATGMRSVLIRRFDYDGRGGGTVHYVDGVSEHCSPAIMHKAMRRMDAAVQASILADKAGRGRHVTIEDVLAYEAAMYPTT